MAQVNPTKIIPAWVTGTDNINLHQQGVDRGFDKATLNDELSTYRAHRAIDVKQQPGIFAGILVFGGNAIVFVVVYIAVYIAFVAVYAVEGKDHWSTMAVGLVFASLTAISGSFVAFRATQAVVPNIYISK